MRKIAAELTRDKIVSELRRDILYGNFKSNEELYQDKIADEFGVSRMPVREALQILHNDGLVTVRPNKVATVNEISEDFITGHFDLRALLEKEAIRLAVVNHMKCDELWDAYNKAEKAIDHHDLRDYNIYNNQIHKLIWHASGNVHMEKMLSQLWNAIAVEGDLAEKEARLSNMDHRDMIAAIEAGDADKAMEVVERHVRHSCSRSLKHFSSIVNEE